MGGRNKVKEDGNQNIIMREAVGLSEGKVGNIKVTE